jgi:hypothetical protein
VSAEGSNAGERGFWAVAFAFLIVMAFGTLPSPLYGLYRTRDHRPGQRRGFPATAGDLGRLRGDPRGFAAVGAVGAGDCGPRQ